MKETKKILLLVFTISILFFSKNSFASPQMPDYIIYEKDTIATYNLILESYLQKLDSTNTENLFGLSFRKVASFNCWRGYQAIYKIDNDSLFLVYIINCGELRNGNIDKKASIEKMKIIFGDKLTKGNVYVDWFNGDLNFPLSNNILRWDGVFYKIYEKERVINIFEGKVLNINDVENYFDDPKGIDRMDKSKISDILFKQLKKVKWKNENGFDCSDEFLITIDEVGKVSKVRMLYSDEEIEKYYEKEEYSYCISQMLNGLKSLKFDIIKDKGKPISEDVYLEIWVEDNGKIKNWTD